MSGTNVLVDILYAVVNASVVAAVLGVAASAVVADMASAQFGQIMSRHPLALALASMGSGLPYPLAHVVGSFLCVGTVTWWACPA